MSKLWLSHDILLRVIEFRVIYEARSPLRIGSGKAASPPAPIDLPVIRIKIGDLKTPYIPGSSLKGVFRAVSEAIMRSVGLKACMAGDECRKKERELHSKLENGASLNDILKFVDENYCLACKFYGVASIRSHIDFENAYPVEGKATTGVKTGIAIDRRSGSVKRRALYTIEFVNPGSFFKGKIIARNLPNYGLGLLWAVIKQFNEGLSKLGGFKTRGFGEVKITVKEIDGFVLENGVLKKLSSVEVLTALDNDDAGVPVAGLSPEEFLKKCEEVWWQYVERQTSKGHA